MICIEFATRPIVKHTQVASHAIAAPFGLAYLCRKKQYRLHSQDNICINCFKAGVSVQKPLVASNIHKARRSSVTCWTSPAITIGHHHKSFSISCAIWACFIYIGRETPSGVLIIKIQARKRMIPRLKISYSNPNKKQVEPMQLFPTLGLAQLNMYYYIIHLLVLNKLSSLETLTMNAQSYQRS